MNDKKLLDWANRILFILVVVLFVLVIALQIQVSRLNDVVQDLEEEITPERR